MHYTYVHIQANFIKLIINDIYYWQVQSSVDSVDFSEHHIETISFKLDSIFGFYWMHQLMI